MRVFDLWVWVEEKCPAASEGLWMVSGSVSRIQLQSFVGKLLQDARGG